MSLVQFSPRLSAPAPRFPNRIRRYRLQAGLSQRDLAAMLHQRRSSVSAWERGRHLPSVSTLFRLARCLDTLGESLYWDLYTAARQDRKAHPDHR
jgi:transcriptional regulator with XRE-family HTH domain